MANRRRIAGTTIRSAREWRAHLRIAQLIRASGILVPFAVATGVGLAIHRLEPGQRTPLITVVWWLIQLASVGATYVAVERAMRMLLPLATLLSLTLVFPDQVPKRFALALRANSPGTLRRRIEFLSEQGDEPDLAMATRTVLERLAALSRHDRWTRGHSERVRAFTDLLVDQIGMSKDDADRVRWAALLHDIGKLDVPAPLLRKTTRLSVSEWETIRRHPLDGARLIGPLREWLGPWALAVDHHHEHYDGSGYPFGLAGTEISFGGRILAVADAFEVMITSRPYKRPVRPDAAREELVRCAGSQFDPQVVRAFLDISIGKIRRIIGPMSLLAEIPFVGTAPRIEALAALAGRHAVTAMGAAGAGALAALSTVGPIAAASAPANPSAVTAVASASLSSTYVPLEQHAIATTGTPPGAPPSPVISGLTPLLPTGGSTLPIGSTLPDIGGAGSIADGVSAAVAQASAAISPAAGTTSTAVSSLPAPTPSVHSPPPSPGAAPPSASNPVLPEPPGVLPLVGGTVDSPIP